MIISKRTQDILLLVGIPILTFSGFWLQSGSDTAFMILIPLLFNLCFVLFVWFLIKAYRTGLIHTAGGGHFDRSEQPSGFWFVFILYAFGTIMAFGLAMAVNLMVLSKWAAS